MAQHIDKDILVAEIKKRRDSFYSLSESCEKGTPAKAGFYAQAQTLEGILSFINSLEVKEVDLEKEIKEVQRNYKTIDEYEGYFATIYASDIELIAKHFFELGLKAQNITTNLKQRISVLKMEFWTGLQTFENSEMTLSDAYSQGINDILEELGIKTQKEE